MEHEHVVSGLLRKRAEIAGHLEVAQKSVAAMQDDLAHIDHAIHLFRPGLNLSGVKVRPVSGPYAAKSGEMLQPILAILRASNEMLGTREIALRLIAQKGLDADDRAFVTVMSRRVATAMNTLKKKGVAQFERGDALELRWSAVED